MLGKNKFRLLTLEIWAIETGGLQPRSHNSELRRIKVQLTLANPAQKICVKQTGINHAFGGVWLLHWLDNEL